MKTFTMYMMLRSYIIEYLITRIFNQITDEVREKCDNCWGTEDDCSHSIRKIDVITKFGSVYPKVVAYLGEHLTTHFFIRRAERHIVETAIQREQTVCCHCLREELRPSTIESIVEDCSVMEHVFEDVLKKVATPGEHHHFTIWPSKGHRRPPACQFHKR